MLKSGECDVTVQNIYVVGMNVNSFNIIYYIYYIIFSCLRFVTYSTYI